MVYCVVGELGVADIVGAAAGVTGTSGVGTIGVGGTPTDVAASVTVAWAAEASEAGVAVTTCGCGVPVRFSLPQFSQTQTVLPSLVVTAWQLVHWAGLTDW